jgi:hypothetical protein
MSLNDGGLVVGMVGMVGMAGMEGMERLEGMAAAVPVVEAESRLRSGP